MGVAARLALSLVLVASVVAGAGVAPDTRAAAATSPSVTVTVDGSAVDDGNGTFTETDPAVGIEVTADERIDVVAVRLDGETRARYTPNATSFATSSTLEMQSGEHTLTVVAKAGAVTTHEVTITKDDARPYVRYTGPFESDLYASPPSNPTVNRTAVTIAGDVSDVTGLHRVRLVRETTYGVGSRTERDRATYRRRPDGDAFAVPVFLGVGDNNITAQYYDGMGHRREHSFTITVRDTAPPTLSGLSVVRTAPDELRIRGRATDNGQLASVSVRATNQSNERYLLGPTSHRPDPDRQRHAFETTVSLPPGTTAVVLNATDTAGNYVERTVSVRRTVAPDLTLDPEATRYANASTVVVAGRATDGEVVTATVEAVDPESGEVVDIRTLHDGPVTADLAFERRLAAPTGETAVVRLRVRDSAGEEHVTSLRRTLETGDPTPTPSPTPTATPPPTATPTVTATPSPTATPTATSAPPAEPQSSGVTVPLLGVTVPVPSALGASVALPVPVVGPFEVPLAPVALLALVGGGVVARRR